jgi:hypothetical protein
MSVLCWRTARQIVPPLVLAAASLAGTGFAGCVLVAAGQPTLQEPRRMETYDDLLVRVEEQAPGFGGMFIDREGRLAVYLLDPSQLAGARSAIETVFGVDRIPAAGVRALKGHYVVSQLKRWSEGATALLELPGVTVVDLDEGRNRVAIGVEDESRTQAVEQALSRLAIPRGAVAIDVTGEIRPLRARIRPHK